MDRPTFTPSLRVFLGNGQTCHLFVIDGRIRYTDDASHPLRGQTVDMPDWEEEKTMTEDQKTPEVAPELASAPSPVDSPSTVETPAAEPKESPAPQKVEDDGRPTCSRCGKKMHTGARTDWVCQTAGCGFSMSNEEFSRRKAAQARKA
jgi:hypothetical protein